VAPKRPAPTERARDAVLIELIKAQIDQVIRVAGEGGSISVLFSALRDPGWSIRLGSESQRYPEQMRDRRLSWSLMAGSLPERRKASRHLSSAIPQHAGLRVRNVAGRVRCRRPNTTGGGPATRCLAHTIAQHRGLDRQRFRPRLRCLRPLSKLRRRIPQSPRRRQVQQTNMSSRVCCWPPMGRGVAAASRPKERGGLLLAGSPPFKAEVM
jgi:hypothetical protein